MLVLKVQMEKTKKSAEKVTPNEDRTSTRDL